MFLVLKKLKKIIRAKKKKRGEEAQVSLKFRWG